MVPGPYNSHTPFFRLLLKKAVYGPEDESSIHFLSLINQRRPPTTHPPAPVPNPSWRRRPRIRVWCCVLVRAHHMAETDKRLHIYERNVKTVRLCIAMRDVVRRVRDWLRAPLQIAVHSNSTMGVAYLLSHGVPPNHGNVFLVASALDSPVPDVEMAKLLRAHHAPLDRDASRLAIEAGGLFLIDALRDPPSSGVHRRKPVPAYHFVRNDRDGPHMRVCQSWPPAGMPDSVPAEAYTLPDDVRGHLIPLWNHIGVLRREEAKQLRKYNWRRARLLVKMMATRVLLAGRDAEAPVRSQWRGPRPGPRGVPRGVCVRVTRVSFKKNCSQAADLKNFQVAHSRILRTVGLAHLGPFTNSARIGTLPALCRPIRDHRS